MGHEHNVDVRSALVYQLYLLYVSACVIPGYSLPYLQFFGGVSESHLRAFYLNVQVQILSFGPVVNDICVGRVP